MNLLCGFWAILINDPVISFYYVLVAIVFDFFDGLSARALKVQSMFGAELDSLADMVHVWRRAWVPLLPSRAAGSGRFYSDHVCQNAASNTLVPGVRRSSTRQV